MCKVPKITRLQCLKENVKGEGDFLSADKHQGFTQVDTTILGVLLLMGMIKHSQSSQNSKFAMSLQYLKKEVKDDVDLDKH